MNGLVNRDRWRVVSSRTTERPDGPFYRVRETTTRYANGRETARIRRTFTLAAVREVERSVAGRKQR